MPERAADRAIRTAMLLVAPAEQVYSELLSFPTAEASAEAGLTDLDKALLGRNDPLITLAVARTTKDTDVLRDLYNSARVAVPPDERQSAYFYGLRVACLSNPAQPRLSFARAPAAFIDEEELARIIQDGKAEETEALFLNPSITGLLKNLLARAHQFASLEEHRWCSLVWVAARNERLNTDASNRFGPDLGAWDIKKSVAALGTVVPVSEPGARTLISVLERVHTHTFQGSKIQLEEALRRWRDWVYEPEQDREFGWSEDLKSEVLALLGAITGSYSIKDNSSKYSSGSIKSFDSADLAERCAFYSIERLSDKQMESAYKRDNEYFLRSVFVNSSVMWNRAQRNFIEERLPEHLVWRYKHHCRVFKRERSDFDDSMQSSELRENVPKVEAILTEKFAALEAQVRRLEDWMKSTKTWVICASLIIAGLIIWGRH